MESYCLLVCSMVIDALFIADDDKKEAEQKDEQQKAE